MHTDSVQLPAILQSNLLVQSFENKHYSREDNHDIRYTCLDPDVESRPGGKRSFECSDKQDASQFLAQPQFLSYDSLIFDGRAYVRDTSADEDTRPTSANYEGAAYFEDGGDTMSTAQGEGAEKDDMYLNIDPLASSNLNYYYDRRVIRDVHFGSLRSVFRKLLDRKIVLITHE